MFNGGLQAVIGLRDAAALTHSKRAERLFVRGERAARREVAAFDTGAWSLYSEHGAEATLNYHSLIAGFLDGLCDRVKRRVYCSAGKRFDRYEREPTRIGVAPAAQGARRPHRHRAFTLSKISTVKVRRVGQARDEPVARPQAPARPPRAVLAPARPRPLQAADRGAGAERAARRRDPDDPDHAAEAEAEEEGQEEERSGATIREEGT